MFFKRVIVCIAITLVCAFSLFGFSLESHSSTELHVPTMAEVKGFGYPVNALGETYGPDMKDGSIGEPDLLLAYGDDNVLGYIRVAEMNRNPQSSEDALNSMQNDFPKEFNLYLQDGTTIIGTFKLGKEV